MELNGDNWSRAVSRGERRYRQASQQRVLEPVSPISANRCRKTNVSFLRISCQKTDRPRSIQTNPSLFVNIISGDAK
jgi:hypothetical protein